MATIENPQYSKDYPDPDKRSIANAIQIRFKDGSATDKITVEYPVGHRRRRAEGIPLLQQKFKTNVACVFSKERQAAILELCKDQQRLEQTPVNEFVDLMVVPKKRDGV